MEDTFCHHAGDYVSQWSSSRQTRLLRPVTCHSATEASLRLQAMSQLLVGTIVANSKLGNRQALGDWMKRGYEVVLTGM
jgi:hypothetical protein